MLIDTHAHLFWEDYKEEVGGVIERAKKNGVTHIVCPGVDIESSKKSLDLSQKYPIVVSSVGIHPEVLVEKEVDDVGPLLRDLREVVEENKDNIVAIGEIGIDLNTKELRDALPLQKELFKEQVKIALQYKLPIIVHTRESIDEAIESLDLMPSLPGGVFHCFSSDLESMNKVLERGFHVSFCGNVTWSKRVTGLVPLVPQDRLLLETDSPFMTPRDSQGNPISSLRNEPGNVRILANIQAKLRGEEFSDLVEYTGRNAVRLFGL